MPLASETYAAHYETLVALVTHLAVRAGESDAVSAPRLAQRLGIDAAETKTVLDSFPGLFRKSEAPHDSPDYGAQYESTLQRRSAHRTYAGVTRQKHSGPLSNEELFSLLDLIARRVNDETANSRQARTNQITLLGVWLAAALSLTSALIGLLR